LGELVSALKFSIVIPFKQRLDNIKLSFESLARQTMDSSEFEVVVGVMEYSEEYMAACKGFTDRITVTSVVSARDWQTGYARNLAMRQASGEVIVLLDADMVLPHSFLENLYGKHFAEQQNACVVGQMLDYDNNSSEVESVAVKPYEYYEGLLAGLEASGEVRSDPRLHVEHVIPWAFAWTALLALPAQTVRSHDLFFDLEFRGYGVEDLEWAYRVSAAGIPITMGSDLYGIHLPHARSIAANQRAEALNYRYFVSKWPGIEVELAAAFGDFEANSLCREFKGELSRVVGSGASLAVVRGEVDGVSTLLVGAVADVDRRLVDPDLTAQFATAPTPEILPLVGLCLPYADHSVTQGRLLPTVAQLSDRYRERILAEAERVCRTVVPLPDR
jgi:GT2 family glycosyltransferase